MDKLTWILDIISLAYIALPLVFLLGVAFYYLRGRTISAAAWTQIVNVGQWYLLSVAVVFAGKLVEKGFTERETGIKEMAIYDKYTTIILKADSVDQAWALTRFFAAVTPTDRLKEGWKEYFKLIDPEYQKIRDDRRKRDSIVSSSLPQRVKDDSAAVINSRIQQTRNGITLSVSTKATGDPELAKEWERKAFEALIRKDIDAAVAYFTKTNAVYDTYHQAYELARYLESQKPEMLSAGEAEWQDLYKTVLKQFSYGMPGDIRQQMERLVR